ncbi:Alpha/Beta hydrolase protein [Corynascus novoguineensis]|uniref:Alpha/Beta hydrolase protein n=1 Tax=Corynascus novoguineensis TaxID=1126955 RepID=A0AAN7CZF5_9PEZI|nr:Alpha/Beta hydrolase protein [Corynascus novoguineensis]
MDPDGSSSSGGFGPVHVIKPSSKHTHTAVMLHGRGSNGPEFAEEIAETAAPGQKPLTARFPTWRWVFLSSQELWSTAFQETLPAWFEAHSLTDTSVRQDMQMDGIRYSVAYIHSVLDREVARLGGDSKKLILIGISQGAAIALWALLCQQNLCKRFGALVGASAWLPFAATIQKFLSEVDGLEAAKKAPKVDSSDVFAAEMLSAWGRFRAGERTSNSLLHTPVFLGHGVDDAVVDIELGREARKVLAEPPSPFYKRMRPMDTFETSKPDRLHQSLSSAWANFLGAQQCTREISALKRVLDEHTRETHLSITSLQRDTTTKHDLLSTAVSDAKFRIEQHAANLKEVNISQAQLSSLQQKVEQERQNTSKKITDLSEKVLAQEKCLDSLRSTASQDIRALQQQYRLTVEEVEALREELRERLVALESRVMTMSQTNKISSEESVKLLERLLSHREDLRLLDQHFETRTEEPTQQQAKRPVQASGSSQDIRSLYLIFRDRYKTNPPKSDTVFIWQFINSIEDPAMSKHIQESLTTILPEHVTPSRERKRRKNPRKHIDISKGLTWRKFREALVKIPGPS